MEENIDTSRTAKINNILAALIITISFIVIGISGSYAYFLNEVVDENKGDSKNVTVSSGELKMTFATEQEKYIKVTDAMLINDDELLTEGEDNYTEFTISLPGDAKVDSAFYEIFLTDIEMTDNFKNDRVKWALYKVTDGDSIKETKQKEGNFKSVNLSETNGTTISDGKKATNSLTIEGPLPDNGITISKGATDKYRLYIWLSNDPNNNQSGLLNGKLSAKVGFRAITKAATS